ncbi:response regulator transcription factor [Coraliomargarita algicola]|uniref:Response regulator transcription factor n=1 Tax=Coraliomargarita algicola TaxID=3092156 RepID=A0ABZ0RQC2_9BACT|nr:response regulator transcription factor [Coraliomargarita sp. J2-16]WPJ97707.1 response regulator transcription factor [Coraliomargarita sp. J2-16]
MRILVIEDYSPLRTAMVESLESAGYAVDASVEGEEGLWYAQNHDYDTIVLDIMLPKMNGLEILETIRAEGKGVPMIIISARDSVDHRIEGLDAGADDYLVKPFALKELLARVRAQTRKAYDKRASRLLVGDLSIDLSAKRVERAGAELKLTAQEDSLLEYLALREGEVVSRQEIWDHVYNYYEDASSNAVDVYIGYLRKKLGTGTGATYIQTRRGQGYLLEYQTV